MFAFLVLSSSPGYEIKVFGVGTRGRDHLRRDGDPGSARAGADGACSGGANWWLPHWTRRALFIREERRQEPALEG